MSRSSVVTRPVPTTDPAAFDDPSARPTANLQRGAQVATDVIGVNSIPTFDRYEILGELGRGGMGVVFKAVDRDLKRAVAIKMILNGTMAAFDALTRFKAETEAVGRLDHPNLVRIYETGHVEGRPYAVMEYIDGGTLADHIAYRTFAPQDAARIIADLADAVESAHQCGVLHRDLKPANILLRGEQPKIVDFGLAKLEGAADCTQTGDVIGTPNYMAPERVTGPKTAIGVGVDIYALGAILFEMLTKHMPFEGATPVEVLRLVLDQDVPSVRSLRRDVARDLDTICRKCLHKNPLRRYSSAKELADDLRRYLRGEAIHARPIGTVERLWRWTRRHPTIAVFLGLFFTVLTAVAIASTMAARSYRTLAENEKNEKERAEKSAKEAIWRTYQGNMAAVASHLQLNNYEAAKSALERAQKHRGWEWYYYHAQLDLSSQTRSYGDGEIYPLRRSKDGNTLFFPKRGVLYFVTTNTGELQRTVTADFGIGQQAWSPDEKQLAFSTNDGRLWVEDLASQARTELPTKDVPGATVAVPQWSRNSRYVVAEYRETPLLMIFDRTTHKRHVVTVPEKIYGLFPGERDELVVNTPKGFFWYSLADGQQQHFTASPHAPVRHLYLTPDGTHLVSLANYPDNTIRIWNVAQRQLVHELNGHKNTVHVVAFMADGQRFLTASHDQTVRLWDWRKGQLLHTFVGHSQAVTDVLVTPDQRTAISTSIDGSIRCWDIASGTVQTVIPGHMGGMPQTILHPNGTMLISNTNTQLRWYDLPAVRRRTFLGQHDSFVYGLALSPDGHSVASAGWDQKARVWDLETGRPQGVFHHSPGRMVTGVAFHPHRSTVLSIVRDPEVNGSAMCEWDLGTGKQLLDERRCTGNYHSDTAPSFSADQQWLATGGLVALVSVTPARGGPVVNYHMQPRPTPMPMVGVVGWHPQSELFATGAEDGTLVVWQRGTTTSHHEWQGHRGPVTDVRYSPDGRWLATAGEDAVVEIWDATTFEKRATLTHGSTVYQAAWHPTEPRLATACADGSIRLWDTEKFEEVAELRGHTSYVKALLFTPDGHQLISGSGDGTVRAWDKRPMRQQSAP